MDKALLDTDIFSEILKGIDRNIALKSTTYRAIFRQYTISAITVMEIIKGFHKVQREAKIQLFLSHLSYIEIVDFEIEIAEIAGRIYADLERTGQPIGRADPMIAATAIQNNLVLITGNQAHYKRIQALGYNLKLDNWR